LAHALELARSLATQFSVAVLVTDGCTNVSVAVGDPLEEALNAAGKIECPAVVVDSSLDASTASSSLASAMTAPLIRLDDLSRESLLNVLPS
jgi:Mg-chelatase subunit ChlD